MDTTAEDGRVTLLRSEGLVKRYRKRTVVNDVSVEVRRGEVVGLLGRTVPGRRRPFT